LVHSHRLTIRQDTSLRPLDGIVDPRIGEESDGIHPISSARKSKSRAIGAVVLSLSAPCAPGRYTTVLSLLPPRVGPVHSTCNPRSSKFILPSAVRADGTAFTATGLPFGDFTANSIR